MNRSLSTAAPCLAEIAAPLERWFGPDQADPRRRMPGFFTCLPVRRRSVGRLSGWPNTSATFFSVSSQLNGLDLQSALAQRCDIFLLTGRVAILPHEREAPHEERPKA